MNLLKHKIILTVTILALTVVCVLFRHESFFPIITIAIIILFLTLTIYGSFQIKWNYYVNSINKGSGNAICFTFDDGPDPEITPKILEVLESENLKAAFFVIGSKVERYPDIVKELYSKGHVIANHTYSHSNKIVLFTSNKLKDDIDSCSKAIEKATGKPPTLFRPPYGVTTPCYARVLKQLGLKSIGWTLRSFDTMMKSKEELIERVSRLISPGSIVLFHDNRKTTLAALPEIINHCKKNGIKIASFSELTGLTT